MGFGRGNAVSIAFEGEDNVSPVVRGIRNSMEGFKKDAKQGFGLAAGFNIMSTAMNVAGQAAGAAIGWISDSITMAADFEEQASKVDVVFGDSAESVREWGATTAEAFGISNTAALESAGTFGAMFAGMGFAEEGAASLSISLVELGADLGSFYNIAEDEALAALRSGLVGEAEPLRRFGVLLNAAAVDAEVLSLGLAKTKSGITEQMKVMGRWAIISRQTSVAQGDFGRTADGMGNSLKSINAQLADLQTEIGQEFLPVVKEGLVWFRDNGIDIIKDIIDGVSTVADILTKNPAELIFGDMSTGNVDRLNEATNAVANYGRRVGMTVEAQELWLADLTKPGNLFEIYKIDGVGSIDAFIAANVRMENINYSFIIESQHRVASETERWGTIAERSAAKLQGFVVDAKELEKALKAVADPDFGDRGTKKERKETEKDAKGASFGIKGLRSEEKRLEEGVDRAVKNGNLATANFRQVQLDNVRANLRSARIARNHWRAVADGVDLVATAEANAVSEAEAFRAQADTPIVQEVVIDITPNDRALMTSFGIPGKVSTLNVIVEGINNDNPNRRRQKGEHGGSPGPNETFLIGESGPELLTMGNRGATINPIAAGGGGGDIYLDGRLVGKLLDARLGGGFGGQRGRY